MTVLINLNAVAKLFKLDHWGNGARLSFCPLLFALEIRTAVVKLNEICS